MRRTRDGKDPPFETTLPAARAGEGWAFAALYHRWNQPLTAFATARGVVEVDDVVSETFLGAFRGIDRFEGTEGDFRAWLFRIARNKIADSFRRAGRRPLTTALPPGFDPTGGDAEVDALAEIDRHLVATLLAELTDDQSEVLLLRLVGDLTIAQIATVLDLRPGAVKARQRRGLERLRQLLTGRADPQDAYPPAPDRAIPRLR